MVTVSEIEELIVRLHKEGKTIKEISKLVHKNYTFIGAVLRKRFPEEYPDNNTMNKETKALKFFSRSKTPTQVAIKLGWNFDQTEKMYLDFWRLEGLYELYTLYKEHARNLREFLHFLNQLRERKVTTRRGFNKVLKYIDEKNATEELADFKQSTGSDDFSTDVLV
jgi:hypothetical protein